jgi:glycosyltransferase involved in cell wall biosynthesis
MKLLVFAHTPPPVHGQSVMVQTMLDGLRGDARFEVYHVNPQLSRASADIGRWRLGKFFALLAACVRAWGVRWRHGPAVFYYVPAPGKRSALYRDFAVMLLCRPFFPQLVLHWHASGLGEWLESRATRLERTLAHRLLGHADLAIVLGEGLRADAVLLRPRETAVVRNGIPDPVSATPGSRRTPGAPLEALFIGLCCEEKGIFDALAAVLEVNRNASTTLVRLTVAGDFPDASTRARFERLSVQAGAAVRHVGFVRGADKKKLFTSADTLLFPTFYPHETQGLVVAEALAHDVPVIVTRWRAVHEDLPTQHVYCVEPRRTDQIASALRKLHASPAPAGELREYYLAHYTDARFHRDLSSALLSLSRSHLKPAAAAVSQSE